MKKFKFNVNDFVTIKTNPKNRIQFLDGMRGWVTKVKSPTIVEVYCTRINQNIELSMSDLVTTNFDEYYEKHSIKSW